MELIKAGCDFPPDRLCLPLLPLCGFKSGSLNQVYQLNTQVIKMMKVGGRSGGWACVNILFQEHTSATV